MAEVMRHRFTEVPLAIFNINGTIRRNIKSKLIQCLHLEEVSSGLSYISVLDMGFIWRIYMPTREETETDITWGDYAKNILNIEGKTSISRENSKKMTDMTTGQQ